MGKLFTTGWWGGSVSPLDLPNCELYLDASLESGYANGADVTTPTDWSGKATGFTQATPDDKPHYVTGAFGGLPGFDFDGADHYWSTAGMSVASGDKTWIIVGDWEDAITTQHAFDSNAGALIFGCRASGPNGLALHDGTAWREPGVAVVSEPQVVVYTIKAGTATGSIHKNLNLVGAKFNAAAATISGTTAIGRRQDADSNHWEGPMGTMIGYSRALGDSERIALTSSLMQKWGIS